MTQDWRRQPPLVEVANVSKWMASTSSMSKRYHRNEALHTLIELLVVMRQANRLGKGSALDGRMEIILDDLSVSIPRGCVVGVVDIGGLSKGALLDVLGNVQPPNRGEVRFFGRSASTRQVNLFTRAHATCKQNLANSANVSGLSRAEIQAALERVPSFSGLGQYLDLPQRRVPKWVLSDLGISLFCCLELDLLIVEEADCATSDKVRSSWRDYVRLAPEVGRTLLIGSRRINNVFELSTHLLLLEHGRLLDFGPLKELREQHAEFLQTAAEAPIRAVQVAMADDPDDDDEEEVTEQDEEADAMPAAAILVPEIDQSQRQPTRRGGAKLRLDFDPNRFLDATQAYSSRPRPRQHVSASQMCRIVQQTTEGTEAGDEGSQLVLLSTTDPVSGNPSKPSLRGSLGARLVIPVETLFPSLRLRPELEFSRSKSNGPILRIRADREIFVSEPSRLVIEAQIPPNRLAAQRYAVQVLLTAAESERHPRRLCARDRLKFRVIDHEGENAAEIGCDLHGSGVWWLQRAASNEADGIWLRLPASDSENIATTKEGIPIVDHSEDFQFSMLFVVDQADTEVSAWLKLTTPAGHAIRYRMAIPERITEPGNYSISVIVPGQELGTSLFRVTMMILIGVRSREAPEQLQSEGSIVVERSGGRQGRDSALTGAPCAMELEQRWSVQYVGNHGAEQSDGA
jgi:ABC-type polysaccharide/polyol phosphate transport system ATPase subunit